jgi:hypothetical protein
MFEAETYPSSQGILELADLRKPTARMTFQYRRPQLFEPESIEETNRSSVRAQSSLLVKSSSRDLRFGRPVEGCTRSGFDADLNSSKRVRSVAYVLRRLSEGAQEATAHPLAIAESSCAGDLFDRQTALLEHESGSFEPEIFDGLGGRLSGLCSEHAGELAWTETRSFSKLSQG